MVCLFLSAQVAVIDSWYYYHYYHYYYYCYYYYYYCYYHYYYCYILLLLAFLEGGRCKT